MMMKTHIKISKSLLGYLESEKNIYLDEKHFIYGNIKPDIFSKYKLRKHYMYESYDMVRTKIEYLASLDMKKLEKYYTRASFSQEIGVACHFLADFFCVAHSERWEFKNNMKIHLSYEKGLTKFAKEYYIENDRTVEIDNIDAFFEKMYIMYKANGNFEKNDMRYASYMCNTITNYILDNILENSSKINIVA